MKLVSLNTWGGKVFEPLINFIKDQSKDTDIFCLQEIYDTTSNIKQYNIQFAKTEIQRVSDKKDSIRANLLEELKKVLTNFQIFYFPTLFGFDDIPQKVYFELSYGQAIFVKKVFKITSHKDNLISHWGYLDSINKDFSDLTTPLQQVTIENKNKQIQIFNFHGTPFPGNKLDSSLRIKEAKKVREVLQNCGGEKILVGDFNLLPDTESIKIHEQYLINLIKKFNIKKTRSKLSPYFDSLDFQKFADFTFVSPDINVSKFDVPDVEISDHLPMILEFL